MKKNKMMRLASCLLVMVLLTTSMISGTFAKYVTAGEGTDTARVAKFGVAVTANGETFAETYTGTDAATTVATGEVGTDVVAPGTSGNMASMTLSGTPEVAVKVNYDADFALSSNWTVDGKYYCPLVINVEGTYVKGTDFDSAAKFEAAVENLINGWTKSYAPNTDLSTVPDDSVSISWEWPFEGDDAKDTWLGNQAAAGNPATVTLTVETTVTQID